MGNPMVILLIVFFNFKVLGINVEIFVFLNMERFLYAIRNKYLLASVAFVIWMLFFDRNDVSTQYGYQREKSNLEREKAYYEEEIASIKQSIKNVQNNPSEIQRIAREKYQMKRDQEDVYVIVEKVPEDK